MKKANFKKIIKTVLPVLVVSGVLWFFFIREKESIILARKIELKDRVVLRTVTASGVIESKYQANLSFQSVGKITAINVKEGDEVKKWQFLASIDYTSQAQTVQYYKDALDIKIRQKELFVDDYTANKELLGGDKRFNMKLREYEEAISQAQAAYQAQRAILSNSTIYAPFNGIAIDVTKDVGETATTGETIVTIADVNNLIFKIRIDQEDYGLLKEGQDVDIKLDSYGNEVFNGKVLKLPYFANTGTEQFDVEISIAQKENKPIRVGMKGDAYIILETSGKEVKSLTVDEISYDNEDKPYVWILENGKIKKQPVELGIEGDVYIEIKNEIAFPILVSAKDGQKIIEGYKAKIIN